MNVRSFGSSAHTGRSATHWLISRDLVPAGFGSHRAQTKCTQVNASLSLPSPLAHPGSPSDSLGRYAEIFVYSILVIDNRNNADIDNIEPLGYAFVLPRDSQQRSNFQQFLTQPAILKLSAMLKIPGSL